MHAMRATAVRTGGAGGGRLVLRAAGGRGHAEAGKQLAQLPARAKRALGRDIPRPALEMLEAFPALFAFVFENRHGIPGMVQWFTVQCSRLLNLLVISITAEP